MKKQPTTKAQPGRPSAGARARAKARAKAQARKSDRAERLAVLLETADRLLSVWGANRGELGCQVTRDGELTLSHLDKYIALLYRARRLHASDDKR